jgi:hypothetical protein
MLTNSCLHHNNTGSMSGFIESSIWVAAARAQDMQQMMDGGMMWGMGLTKCHSATCRIEQDVTRPGKSGHR